MLGYWLVWVWRWETCALGIFDFPQVEIPDESPGVGRDIVVVEYDREI